MKLFGNNVRLGVGLSICVFVSLIWAGTGWGKPAEQLTINYIETLPLAEEYINQVQAYVTVTDNDQRPVPGLSLLDFKALEDGRAVDISEAAGASDPMAVVLAIDTSGSMLARDRTGLTSMGAAKKAARRFIAMLGAQDQVALFSFNKEPILHLDFSTDHDRALRAVDGLAAEVNAPTRLYDTAFEAVKKAAEIPRGRRAIILLTDGKDEKGGQPFSVHGSNDVIDAATTKTIRVPIYTIGAGPRVDAKELARIAGFTGGRSMLAASTEALERFYQIIAEQLKNQYVIKYRSQTPSGEHSLVVKVRHESGTAQDEKRFWAPPQPVLPAPVVSFVRPGPADEIKGPVDVKVKIESERTVAKVRYYVDAALKTEINEPPFNIFKWDLAGLTPGLHILRVEVKDIKGQMGSAEFTHQVTGSFPPQHPGKLPGAEEASSALKVSLYIIGMLALVLAAGGILFYFRVKQRRQAASVEQSPEEKDGADMRALPDVEEDQDEDGTIYIKDIGESEDPGRPASAVMPAAFLMVVQSQHLTADDRYDISGTTLIGRSPTCEVSMPDKSVSRKHAEIYQDDGRYFIRDIGSKYGTKVDGRDINTNRVELIDGAQIELGPKTAFKFHLHAVTGDPDDRTKPV